MHRFAKKIEKKVLDSLKMALKWWLQSIIVTLFDRLSEAELSSATYFCFDLRVKRRIAQRIAGLNYAAIHKINGQPWSVIHLQPSVESAHNWVVANCPPSLHRPANMVLKSALIIRLLTKIHNSFLNVLLSIKCCPCQGR